MLNPLRAGMFNAVDGRCALSHQVILTMRYVIAERCHDSVLCIGVRDPRGGQMVSSTLYQPCLLEGPDFLDFTQTSNISCDLS